MLVLFDIDMTLLATDHVGLRFLEEAGRGVGGEGFSAEGVEFGGCLDPDIIARLLTNNGAEASAENVRLMREGYHASMAALHEENPGWATALPGAPELVEAVRAMDPRPLCGLLTGNFQETGAIKLRGAGYDPEVFEVCVWGDESPEHPPSRDQLPPVAIERARGLGVEFEDPSQVVIIGDTVHDVRCALAHGCSVLAVATGHHDADALRDAGAHLVVDDLTDTQGVMTWIEGRLHRSHA